MNHESEVGGRSTRKSFRFVRACVRAVWLPSGIGLDLKFCWHLPLERGGKSPPRKYRRLGVSPCGLHNHIPCGPSNIETNTTFENAMRVASDSVENPMVEVLIERLSWDMNILMSDKHEKQSMMEVYETSDAKGGSTPFAESFLLPEP